MIYFKFSYPITFSPPKGCIGKFFYPDKNTGVVDVDSWYIEFDIENDCVNRELGFDVNGNIVYYAPSDMFYGYWLDADMKLNSFENFDINEISKTEFFKFWKPEYDLNP